MFLLGPFFERVEFLIRDIDQLIEIQSIQRILDEIFEIAVFFALQTIIIVQIPIDAIMDEINIHLDRDLIVRDSGIPDSDLFQIVKLCRGLVL